MRVIKSEPTNDWPKRYKCYNCGALLEYDKEDVFYAEMGLSYVTCPECGENVCVNDGERNLAPLFPVTFFKSEVHKDELSNTAIQRIVNDILSKTYEEWEEDAEVQDCLPHWISDGNAFVLVAQDDDGIAIIVVPGDTYTDYITYQDLKKFYK